MQLPFFYISEYNSSEKEIMLGEDTSRHIISALRIRKDEQLNLTDGKGIKKTVNKYARLKAIECGSFFIKGNKYTKSLYRNYQQEDSGASGRLINDFDICLR